METLLSIMVFYFAGVAYFAYFHLLPDREIMHTREKIDLINREREFAFHHYNEQHKKQYYRAVGKIIDDVLDVELETAEQYHQVLSEIKNDCIRNLNVIDGENILNQISFDNLNNEQDDASGISNQ